MNDEKNGINSDQETKEKNGNKEPIFYYEDNIKEPPLLPAGPPSYNTFTCPMCGSPKFKRKGYVSYEIIPRRRTRYMCRKCRYKWII